MTEAWQSAYFHEAWAVLIDPEGLLLLSWFAITLLLIAWVQR